MSAQRDGQPARRHALPLGTGGGWARSARPNTPGSRPYRGTKGQKHSWPITKPPAPPAAVRARNTADHGSADRRRPSQRTRSPAAPAAPGGDERVCRSSHAPSFHSLRTAAAGRSAGSHAVAIVPRHSAEKLDLAASPRGSECGIQWDGAAMTTVPLANRRPVPCRRLRSRLDGGQRGGGRIGHRSAQPGARPTVMPMSDHARRQPPPGASMRRRRSGSAWLLTAVILTQSLRFLEVALRADLGPAGYLALIAARPAAHPGPRPAFAVGGAVVVSCWCWRPGTGW